MEPKILLLRRLDELHRLINSSDGYDVLKASATIRQLFLDGGKSLVDKVNKSYKRKYKFKVVDHPIPNIPNVPKPEFWCVVDSIDPRRAPFKFNYVTKNRDDFFSTILGIVHGKEYTISDVIKYVANVMGGVHSGKAMTVADKALEHLAQIYLLPDLNVPLLHIRAVGRIVLETLRGTKEDILDMKRFVGEQGLSMHVATRLHPIGEKKKKLYY